MQNASSSDITAKSIFFAASDIEDLTDRQRFIEESCNGDCTLVEAVARLFDVNPDATGNLIDLAANDLHPGLNSDGEPGETESFAQAVAGNASRPKIERYKLLEEIGRGGMGTVFMAQQTEPVKRRVALKVINPGMDSREVIARFDVERQALAMMDHPNIAKVLDGGTTENGRPYFVMELVRGVPITEYCRDHPLTLEDRLRIYIEVCHAVQHAHQKGIIHRDLKPSNVMVSGSDGVPAIKVIDFGVAKALHHDLTDKTLYTQFSQIVGTPLYISPEQAGLGNLDVDTRSDIYSLGVLLYELLTGTTPFDREELACAGIEGARRVICKREPVRPSTRLSTLEAVQDSTLQKRPARETQRLAVKLRGELDWIVMKAIEKDRTRRYESVADLARDVQRYLQAEPVAARPPSLAYRLKKGLQRHKAHVIAATCAIAALALGVGVVANEQIQQNRKLQEVRESLAVAQAFVETQDYESAKSSLDKAQVQLKESGTTDGQVHDKVVNLTQDVERKLRAAQQYSKFRQPRWSALRMSTGPSHTNPKKQRLLLKDAVQHYRVLDGVPIESIQEYQDLDPASQNQLRQEIGEALFLMAMGELREASNQETEIAACRRAVDLLSRIEATAGPTRGAMLSIGHCWEVVGEEKLAAKARKLAAEIEPNTALDYYMLGQAHSTNEVERLNYYLRALDLDPHHYAAFAEAGWCYLGLGEYDAAEAMGTGAIAMRPEHANRYSLRALARLGQRKFELAESDLDMRAKLRGGRRGGYYAIFLESKGNLAEASASFDEALKGNPWSHVRLARARLYCKLGQHEKAIQDITLLLKQNQSGIEMRGDTEALHNKVCWLLERSLAYADSGQPKLALKDIETVMSIDADRALSMEHLAWFFSTCPDASLQDAQKSLVFAEKAIRKCAESGILKSPAGAKFWQTLGVAQYRGGAWSAAIDSFEAAMKLDRYSHYEAIYGYFLAMSHWQIGQEKQARKWYERASKPRHSRINDWSAEHAVDLQIDDFRQEAAELLGISDEDGARDDLGE